GGECGPAGGDRAPALPGRARVRRGRARPHADTRGLGIAPPRRPGALRSRDRQPLEPTRRACDQRPLPRHPPAARPACAGDLGRVAARPSRHARALDQARPVRDALHAPLHLLRRAGRGALLRPLPRLRPEGERHYSYPVGPLRGSTLVLGVRITGVAKAYPLYLLRRPISDVVAGQRLRIVPDPDALSAAVYEQGRRLPATPVYWFAWHAFYPNTLIYP